MTKNGHKQTETDRNRLKDLKKKNEQKRTETDRNEQ